MAEEKLRQALQISNGELMGLVTPISVTLYVVAALLLCAPLLVRLLPRRATVLGEVAKVADEAHHLHREDEHEAAPEPRAGRGPGR